MKYIFFATAILWAYSSKACDLCGGGSYNSNIGLWPNGNNHFVGIKSQGSSYHTRFHGGSGESKDVFLNTELWGRFLINSNWMITACLPLQTVWRNSTDYKSQYQSLGDASVSIAYSKQLGKDDKKNNQTTTIYLAAGIKSPTGSQSLQAEGIMLPPGLQPGSGSWDGLAMAVCNRFYANWGFGSELSARIARPNQEHYQLGHRLGATVKSYFKPEVQFADIWMSAGCDFEYNGPEKFYGDPVSDTGGTSVLANLGVNWISSNGLNIGIFGQLPVFQNLNQGMTRSSMRGGIQCFYFFGK